MAWLVRCLPPKLQAALVPDLLALKRTRHFSGSLPVADYTWPDEPGVRRPRYLNKGERGVPWRELRGGSAATFA